MNDVSNHRAALGGFVQEIVETAVMKSGTTEST
jgi:hypothetical protein